MQKRLVYIDLLRIVSTFFVILIHVTSIGISNYEIGSSGWKHAVILNSISRWAVPMFFMISGMFFLDPEKRFDVKHFYRRNVFRIILAIVIAGFLYSLLDQYQYSQLSLRSISLAIYGLISGKTGYHLWFLYTLLMLYIATPVLRIITEYASKRKLEYLLVCWILFSICTEQANVFAKEFIHQTDVVPYRAIVITGYAGYYILGYYLKKYPLTKTWRIAAIILGVCSLLAMPIGTVIYSQSTHQRMFDGFQMPLGVGNLFVCIAIMALMAKTEKHKAIKNHEKLWKTAGYLTFFAYLVHVAVLSLLFKNYLIEHRADAFIFITASILVSLCSYFLSWCVYKVQAALTKDRAEGRA